MPKTRWAAAPNGIAVITVYCAAMAATGNDQGSARASDHITSVPLHSCRATDLETLRELYVKTWVKQNEPFRLEYGIAIHETPPSKFEPGEIFSDYLKLSGHENCD